MGKLPASLLLIAAICSTGFLQASEVRHGSLASDILDRDFVYNIYLPDGYADTEYRYPVVYLLHGNLGTENSWFRGADLEAVLNTLIADGAIPPLLVVTPADPGFWWANGRDEQTLTAFVDELLPHIEASYRAMTTRAGRLIGGYSAGGFGTANIALQHPELFAAAAPLSPAVYTPVPPGDSSATSQDTFVENGDFSPALWTANNWVSFIEEYKRKGIVVPFYINTGDHDRFDIAYHAAVFYQALREYQPEYTEFRVFDGDHNFAAWGGSIDEALIYMSQFLEPEN